MQDYAKTIDTTRGITAGISGNWDNGIATAVDVVGYNYIKHGGKETTDKHHREFPNLASWGTEEGSTFATRGIYFEDNEKQYKPAYDFPQSANAHSIEQGWKHYDSRSYLAGMFIWTGFDYRGASNRFLLRNVRPMWFLQRRCLVPKIMVGNRTRFAPFTPLELERKRRTAYQCMGVQQL
jgi:beta-galactosidase